MAYTKAELEEAIKIADASGDEESLKALASAWQSMEITAETEANPITEAVDTETNNYFADQARMGVVDLIEKAVGILGDNWSEMFFPSVDKAEKNADGSKPSLIQPRQPSPLDGKLPTSPAQLVGKMLPRLATENDAYWQDVEDTRQRKERSKQELAEELLGYSYASVDEDQLLQRMGGVATREAIGDPIGTFVGGKGKLGLLQEVLASSVSVAAGSGAAEAVRTWADAHDWSPQMRELVTSLTSLVTGSATGMTAQAGFRALNAGANAVSANKRVIEQVDGAAELMANSQVKAAVKSALKAQPDVDSTINAARALQDKVPGLLLPTAAVLHNNPVLVKNLESLLMVKPEFRARMTKSLADVDTAVTKRQEALFGDSSPTRAEASLSARAAQVDINISNILKRVRGIDSQIETVASPLRSADTAETIGVKVRGLLSAKERALSTAATQKYTNVLSKYSDQGLRFPASSVANLYNTAQTMRYKNLFSDHPRIVNKIGEMYKPKVKGERPSFRSLSLVQLDSLKRAVNEGIRNESNGGKRAELNRFKDVLKAEIDALPGFGKEYQGIDDWYREQIGIPLNQAGIKELDSAKFAEVAGTRLSRPETAREFLSFVGDAQGIPVLRDSLLLRLGDASFSKLDNSLDVNKFIRFVNGNRQVIDLVPGMRNQLRDIGTSLRTYEDTKSRLDVQHTEHAKRLADNVFSTVYQKGLQSTVSSILRSPQRSAELFRSISNYTADTATTALRGVRAGLIDEAMKSPNPHDFMLENSNTFNQWFGERYVDNVKALAEVTNMVSKLDLEAIPHAHTVKDQDIVQEYTGSTIPNIMSQLRDRIRSRTQRATILGSRWFNKKTTDSRDRAMEELFIDPAKLQTIADLAKAKRDNKITVAKFAEGLVNVINFSVNKSYLRADAGSDLMQEESTRFQEQRTEAIPPARTERPSVIPTAEQLMQLNPALRRVSNIAQ